MTAAKRSSTSSAGARAMRHIDCDQRHLPHVGRGIGVAARAVAITKRQRQHCRAGVDRRLQERRVEMLDRAAVGRRALGADRYQPPARERGDDSPVHAAGVAPAAALDEERADTLDQPADEGPLPDLGLGDEERREHGVHGEDVQPRDVVRHEQAAVGEEHRCVVGFHPHS